MLIKKRALFCTIPELFFLNVTIIEKFLIQVQMVPMVRFYEDRYFAGRIILDQYIFNQIVLKKILF